MAKPLPNRIREIRERLGLTQQELADMIGGGATKKTISRYETGETRLNVDMMQRFSAALRVHPQELLNIAAMAASVDEAVELPADEVGPMYAALRKRGITVFKVLSDAVSEAGIKAGDVASVDTAETNRQTGDVLMVRLNGHLVLRQFLAPRTLVTNGGGPPVAVHLDDPGLSVEILGVVIRE